MMPKRFLKYSRTEPARTILWSVGLLAGLAQTAALFLSWPYGLINFAIVVPVCAWAVCSATRNNIKHMSLSSFWLALMWFWTGLTRLLVVEGVGELLWVPFMIIGVVMSIVYLYMSYHRRIGDLA